MTEPPANRFARKVEKSGPIPECRPELGPCWLWTAGQDKDGYGNFWVDGAPMRAHRFSWMLAAGRPVPPDHSVCHHCDNPPCVNPLHLFLGTNLDNIRDKAAKGRTKGNPTGNLGDLKRRLSDADVVAILAYPRSRGTRQELARKYGVTVGHISNIRAGWRR